MTYSAGNFRRLVESISSNAFNLDLFPSCEFQHSILGSSSLLITKPNRSIPFLEPSDSNFSYIGGTNYAGTLISRLGTCFIMNESGLQSHNITAITNGFGGTQPIGRGLTLPYQDTNYSIDTLTSVPPLSLPAPFADYGSVDNYSLGSPSPISNQPQTGNLDSESIVQFNSYLFGNVDFNLVYSTEVSSLSLFSVSSTHSLVSSSVPIYTYYFIDIFDGSPSSSRSTTGNLTIYSNQFNSSSVSSGSSKDIKKAYVNDGTLIELKNPIGFRVTATVPNLGINVFNNIGTFTAYTTSSFIGSSTSIKTGSTFVDGSPLSSGATRLDLINSPGSRGYHAVGGNPNGSVLHGSLNFADYTFAVPSIVGSTTTTTSRTYNQVGHPFFLTLIGRSVCWSGFKDGQLVRMRGTITGYLTNLGTIQPTRVLNSSSPLTVSANLISLQVNFTSSEVIAWDYNRAENLNNNTLYTSDSIFNLPKDPKIVNAKKEGSKYRFFALQPINVESKSSNVEEWTIEGDAIRLEKTFRVKFHKVKGQVMELDPVNALFMV